MLLGSQKIANLFYSIVVLMPPEDTGCLSSDDFGDGGRSAGEDDLARTTILCLKALWYLFSLPAFC